MSTNYQHPDRKQLAGYPYLQTKFEEERERYQLIIPKFSFLLQCIFIE